MIYVRAILLAGTTLAFMPLPSAKAQEIPQDTAEPAAGGEIVVQARKRNERLLDIPETISAITADTIRDAGISSLNDLGRQTPNIILNRRQDNEPNVVIRGVGAFGNTQGVGFYIDDVQNFTDQSASVEDVERIEILKGPQGTLYGGSNIGGAIKYVLKKPTDVYGGEARVEYGGFDTVNAFAAVNAPLADGFAVRASGYYNRTGGYIANTLLGGNPDQGTEWGTRIAIGWQPTDALDVQFSYRHNELSNGGNVYVTAAETDSSAAYRRTVDYNTDVMNKRRVDGGILSVAYDLGTVELTNVTSYTRRKNQLRWDLDYSSADGITAFNGNRDKASVFTQELRLASSGSGPFDWLVGAYYAAVDNRGMTNNLDLLVGPDAGGPQFIENYNNGDTIERQYAAFATANYRIGGLHIGAGLRVARSAFTGRDYNVPLSVNVNDTTVLPKITLSYDLAPDVMVYANLAQGVEPGRVNVTTGTGGAYKSERATSYEAGIKGSALGRSLTFELAGYYIDYKRRQFETQFVNDDGAISEEVTNIGRSVSYGLEGGLSYRPLPGLTLSASGGWLHSRWKDADALYSFVPVDGLTVPNAPSVTANGSIDYRIPVSDTLELGLRGDYSHMGKFYWNILNTSRQKAYDIVNLRASLGAPDGRWEVAVRGENIFNAKYYNEFTADVFTVGEGLGAPGMPARVMASLSFKM
ncbi:TonB-dependent receptor [Novosphingobium resinovorum]|uniref:TonB-dependent receptor n=2 Tax=Novosphingobium TaxID=165696 RepID=UPI0025A15B10|nr:TonB-dependent receptor [Novosphingobium resinovorum]MBF7014307.1 TonB-dependent receptor [Novosphingobium sp. HR1a]WJM25211.1 TonB-dependent receptor [Novosphingobium resinovorum]